MRQIGTLHSFIKEKVAIESERRRYAGEKFE
jgi:hypothetical protein